MRGLREVVASQADVQLRAHRGQWRAQLVRRIRDQTVLLFDAALEPVQHRVQRDREAPDLVARARRGDALVQVVDADLLCLGGHPLDRPERLARHEPPADRGREQGRRAGQQQQHQHPVDRLVDLVQRLRDHQHALLASTFHRQRERPVLLVALSHVDRHHPALAAQHVGLHVRRHDRAGDGIPVRQQHAAAGIEHLRRGAAEREHGAAHVLEVLRALVRVALGDLRRVGPHLAIDRGLEVGPQLQHEERAQARDDRRQQDGVPGGEANADRQLHSTSSLKPTPRTVRIIFLRNGRSSLLRR